MHTIVPAAALETQAQEHGFIHSRARNLAPDDAAAFGQNTAALLVCALCYGAAPASEDTSAAPSPARAAYGEIAAFARRNYYREAVDRLKHIARALRSTAAAGGPYTKSDFRIFSNSRYDEKHLACRYGLGAAGRNSLVLTPEAGSRFIIAGLTLPFRVAESGPQSVPAFAHCHGCHPTHPPCVQACPTGALNGDGTLTRERCIQWYASGNSAAGNGTAGNGTAIPAGIRAHWGRRLYGCTNCQDACPRNQNTPAAARTGKGSIEREINVETLIIQSDAEIKARFKGTALGLSWLSPATLRRSARCVLGLPPEAGCR